MTLVEQESGIPLASCIYHQKGGELNATRQLLCETDVAWRVITMDALHSTFESLELIPKAKADYMLTLKNNTPLQLQRVKSLNWESPQVQRHSEQSTK